MLLLRIYTTRRDAPEVEFLGRRGKPVKKMRLIPAEKAFAFARKLQGTPGCTVSVY